jgi:hypothetical protein
MLIFTLVWKFIHQTQGGTNEFHSKFEPNKSLNKKTVLTSKYMNINILNSTKIERKILKIFLLSHLQKVFYELFYNIIQNTHNNLSMEHYAMDNKIIQLLIKNIIDTGEYTLEGIAYYTHIPFDIIYEAACGINNQFSITSWTKIVSLYIQVKPEITELLINKLLEIKDKNNLGFLSLINDT